MRIGINASFLRKPQTGIGQVSANFLKHVAAIHESPGVKFILYLEQELPKDLKLPENFETRIFLPAWTRDDLIRKIWWEKYLLPKRVKKDKCDVFISLYQSTTILPQKIKHLMLVHDIIPELIPELLNNSRKRKHWKMSKNAIAQADHIIAISRRTEKDLVQKLNVPAEKITVNYIDVDPLYKKSPKGKLKYKLKPGYILAGGGMEARKNIEGVIRAYKFLHDRFKLEKSLPKLVIYGKLLPELAPLTTDAEELIKELNLTKEIKLLGAVPQKDLPTLFKNAEMFIYPSHYEGFGLPILEAMNVGTPVITSKTSSLPEVGSDAVLYCHTDDIHDIAMVMRNVLLNKDLRETLSRRGKERAKNFSWKKFTGKVLNIVESM